MSASRKSERARLATEHAHYVNLALNNGVSKPRAQTQQALFHCFPTTADIQFRWLREAQRLARLFLATSNRRHFRALIRHIYAMAARSIASPSSQANPPLQASACAALCRSQKPWQLGQRRHSKLQLGQLKKASA